MKKLVKKIAYRTIKSEVQMTHKENVLKKIFLIVCVFFISFVSFVRCVDMGWEGQNKTTRSHDKRRGRDVEKQEAKALIFNEKKRGL